MNLATKTERTIVVVLLVVTLDPPFTHAYIDMSMHIVMQYIYYDNHLKGVEIVFAYKST